MPTSPCACSAVPLSSGADASVRSVVLVAGRTASLRRLNGSVSNRPTSSQEPRSTQVLALGHDLDMGGVHTGPVTTQVVGLEAPRYWTPGLLHDPTVGRAGRTLEPEAAVAVSGRRGGPDPTTTEGWVVAGYRPLSVDLRPEASQVILAGAEAHVCRPVRRRRARSRAHARHVPRPDLRA